MATAVGLEEVPLNDEKDGSDVSAAYFFGGLLLTLVISVFSLFTICFHSGLRESALKRRKFFLGVVVALAIHFLVVLALFIYFWFRRSYTTWAG